MIDLTVLPSGDTGDVAWEALTSAARRVADEAARATSWSAAARGEALAAVDAAVAALTTARARILTAVGSSRDWARHGDRDVASWRSRTSRAGSTAARTEVRQAATLQQMPRLEGALLSSAISTTHVDVVARAAAHATPAVAEHLASPAVQSELVSLGRRLDGREFARAVDRVVAQADPASLERDHAVQRANRHLWVTDTTAGTQVRGLLDLRAGDRLRRALEAVAGRPSEADERSAEQRRADALDSIAEGVLASPATAPGAVVPPQVTVVLSEPTWVALTAAVHGQDVAPLAERLRGLPAATDDDGAPLPPSEVARLVCDSALTRVLVDARATPVDLGRTTRLITNEIRRAVVARDQGCAWDGCGIPARWCQGHHIAWWDRDTGATSVDNAVLLCSYHHHRVHEGALRIERLRAPDPPADAPAGAPDRPADAAQNRPWTERPAGIERARYRVTSPDGTVRSEPRTPGPRPGPAGAPATSPGAAARPPPGSDERAAGRPRVAGRTG